VAKKRASVIVMGLTPGRAGQGSLQETPTVASCLEVNKQITGLCSIYQRQHLMSRPWNRKIEFGPNHMVPLVLSEGLNFMGLEIPRDFMTSARLEP
jgi:hypothetical protein